MPNSYRQWIYARPMVEDGLGPEQFELREQPLPELKGGQALVRVKLINIHSNTRLRMALGMTALGETEHSNYACAEVVQSRDAAFKEGDVIACQAGWQDYQIISSADAAIGYPSASELTKAFNHTNSQWTYVFRPVMVKMWPSEVLMEMFGTSGMTAYFGMRQCGPIMPRDSVLVAGATGSVGSIAVQLARIAGAYVVGLAGGEHRCSWVRQTLGIDECIDYRATDLPEKFHRALPDGIDVYSDGIGGTLTKTVVGMMNRNGRFFAYGSAAAFYADRIDAPKERPTLRRMFGISDEVEALLRERHIKSESWIVDAFYHERLKAEDDLSRMVLSGALKPINNVVDGFEKLPEAICGLYQGSRAGKLQVRFEPDRNRNQTRRITMTMKAWRLDRLGGDLRFENVPMPEVRPGSVLVRVEASTLMSYMKPYVEARLPPYHAPVGGFTPGGNCVGTIAAVGKDVWQLAPGRRVVLSSLFRSSENVPDPAQILIGVTSFGPDSEKVQADWPDGTLAEYALLPASAVVPADGFEEIDATQLAAASRFVVPYGGLVRGRLAAGETLIVNGATGAYGSAAVLVALAMGAGRVVAAGRNADKLERLVRLAGKAVVPVVLSGNRQKDAAALREAAGGGAEIAFDMVGGASEPSSTLAALNSLRRGGRLVLMGSMTVDLPVPYMQLMINSLEIIGNFMHPADAYRRVLALIRSGALEVTAITPKVFPLTELPAAMEAAMSADSLECIVMKS